MGAIGLLKGNSGRQKRKTPEEAQSGGGPDAKKDRSTPANRREEERTAGADWRGAEPIQDAGAGRVVAKPGKAEEGNRTADGAGLADPTRRGEEEREESANN